LTGHGNERGIVEEMRESEESNLMEREDEATYGPDSIVSPSSVLSPVMAKDWQAKEYLLKTLIIDGSNPNKGKRTMNETAAIKEDEMKDPSVSTVKNDQDEVGPAVEGNISEEEITESNESMFYRHNIPEPSEASTVRTDEHEFAAKDLHEQEKFNKWLHCTVAINQREFNENMCLGNFKRDENGKIIDRERII
jgi:hypothetical protein